jgi:hypothetical protein
MWIGKQVDLIDVISRNHCTSCLQCESYTRHLTNGVTSAAAIADQVRSCCHDRIERNARCRVSPLLEMPDPFILR